MVRHRWLSVALLAVLGCGSAHGSDIDAGDARSDGPMDAGALDASGHDAAWRDADVVDGAVVPEPPPPPAWDPPFDLGEPGWRDSTEPLCSPYAGRPLHLGLDIWADRRGVFVLETIHNSGTFGGHFPYPDGTTLQLNDGSGWRSWLDLPAEPGTGGAVGLKGTPRGPVWLWPGACTLRRVAGPDDTSCVYVDDRNIADVHMLTATSGWILLGDSLHWLDEAGTEEVAALDSDDHPASVWGETERAIVQARAAIYRVARDTGTTVLRRAEPGEDFTALWAESASRFWVATETGRLLRFDGGEWTAVASVDAYTFELWSDGSSLYFAASSLFGRWTEETGVEVFLDYPGTESTVGIVAMTGEAERGDVYLAFLDGDFVEYACGPAMIVWFDGERFHRF